MVDQINFDQVLQPSADVLRYSLDGTQTFVKYEIVIVEQDYTNEIINPETGNAETITISAGIYGRPAIWSPELTEYDHEGILQLLATPEWSNSDMPLS
jgi:hypothetical protein